MTDPGSGIRMLLGQAGGTGEFYRSAVGGPHCISYIQKLAVAERPSWLGPSPHWPKLLIKDVLHLNYESGCLYQGRSIDKIVVRWLLKIQ